VALTPDQIAALSNDDLEGLYLGTLGGTGSLEDRRQFVYGDEQWVYFSNLSGLTPKGTFTLPDHQYAYYKAQTVATGSLADLERSFWGSRP
jgi:hypothetical protein